MTDNLSRVFAALADPTRRDMVARLAVGDATVGELAAPYGVSLQAVSKHLAVLEQAGLVESRREGREVRYRVRPARLEEASQAMAQAAQAWDRRLQAIKRLAGAGEIGND